MNRRELLYGMGATAAGFGLHTLPGLAQRTKASDKLTIACIGTGSQGLRVLLDLLRLPQVRIVAVCDVEPAKQ